MPVHESANEQLRLPMQRLLGFVMPAMLRSGRLLRSMRASCAGGRESGRCSGGKQSRSGGAADARAASHRSAGFSSTARCHAGFETAAGRSGAEADH